MPYYTWDGIDISGRMHHGKMFASSEQILQEYLLKKDIGLVRLTPIPGYRWTSSISLSQKAAFFKQFAQLLHSGILVSNALVILKSHGHGKLCGVAGEIKANIDRGNSLYNSVKAFPEVFDALALQLIRVGQQSSDLADTLEQLARYLQARVDFYKKLRSQLMMPLITLFFFCAVVSIIFIALVPAFERVFFLTDKQPPVYTQWLFYISSFATLSTLGWTLGMFFVGYLFLKLIPQRDWKMGRDSFFMRLPICKQVIRSFTYSYYFQALSTLCSGGIPVLDAVKFAGAAIKNRVIAQQLSQVGSLIEEGNSLSEALVLAAGESVDAQAEALIRIGEQTNSLGAICADLSNIYFERSQKILSTLLIIVQPALMVLLGIFIAGLIVSVYVPLLNMSDTIGMQF
ncbi:type II secretion system F family protein [bacterium]|jgi:type IV pilus assembly protein PilC|nr:type II secretion system F family protein [bacterium]MBT5015800.1 type II secretion system F family protein [bacterium]